MSADSTSVRLLGLFGGLTGISLIACSGGDLLLPAAGSPAELRLVSGDLQQAETGATLPDPLVVEAVDATGRPVVGSLIVFRFEASTAGARVLPDTAETNGSGLASAQVRLGSVPGAHPVEAAVADGPNGLRVRFVITALAPPPGDGGGGGSGGGDDGGAGGGGGNGDGGGGGSGDDDDDEDEEERGSSGKGKGKDKGKDNDDDRDRGDEFDD